MADSRLEKKTGFISRIKREIKEIKYVGFGHYIQDRTFGGHAHHHKKDGTSKDNFFLYDEFCDFFG